MLNQGTRNRRTGSPTRPTDRQLHNRSRGHSALVPTQWNFGEPGVRQTGVRFLILLAVVGGCLSGCSPGETTTASSALLTARPTVASSQTSCESIPPPQFNLRGFTYTARQSTDTVVEADLGVVLGVQVGDIPQGLLQCEAVQLKDGQGSLEAGAHVCAIRGVDQSIAIAAEVGSVYMKLFAP